MFWVLLGAADAGLRRRSQVGGLLYSWPRLQRGWGWRSRAKPADNFAVVTKWPSGCQAEAQRPHCATKAASMWKAEAELQPLAARLQWGRAQRDPGARPSPSLSWVMAGEQNSLSP